MKIDGLKVVIQYYRGRKGLKKKRKVEREREWEERSTHALEFLLDPPLWSDHIVFGGGHRDASSSDPTFFSWLGWSVEDKTNSSSTTYHRNYAATVTFSDIRDIATATILRLR